MHMISDLPRTAVPCAFIAVLVLAGCAQHGGVTTPQQLITDQTFAVQPNDSPARKELKQEASTAASVATSALAHDWLLGVNTLPSITPRQIYRRKHDGRWLSDDEYMKGSATTSVDVTASQIDERGYYNTFYGTPVTYAFALDVAAHYGVRSLQGIKLSDYGYGAIGTLRMAAAAGATVVGVDVDPRLPALYSQPSDTGVVKDRSWQQRQGQLLLINGNFPKDGSSVSAMAGSDLIITKNTWKKGYLTPDQGNAMINPEMPLDQYAKAFYQALKPGGLMVIYNISMKLNPNDYRPANDGRSPFTKAQYEQLGFKVLAFEQDDSAKIRALAKLQDWEKNYRMPSPAENLFAQYTVLQR